MAENVKKTALKKASIIHHQNESKKTSNNHLYFGYGFRLFVFLFLFLLFFGGGIYALVSSIMIEEEKVVVYHENGQTDYEVCYKQDDFYQGNCFNKNQNMKFIASLIDKIHLSFDYQFDIDYQEKIDFTYDIIGKLVISDPNSNKTYFEKEYSLLAPKKLELSQDKRAHIEESLDIDYAEYNALASQFNRSYGVVNGSKLVVYMNICKQTPSDSEFQLDHCSLSYVTIPLSEKAIDISIDSNQIQTTKDIVAKVHVSLMNIAYALVSVILLLLSIKFFIKFLKLFSMYFEEDSKYDKYISKLLREYDRLIGVAKNAVSFEGKEVIYFKKFTELLDIHDHLGLPIMYYNVTSHVKSYFYIVKDNMVYLYVAKAVDINKK